MSGGRVWIFDGGGESHGRVLLRVVSPIEKGTRREGLVDISRLSPTIYVYIIAVSPLASHSTLPYTDGRYFRQQDDDGDTTA